MRLATYQSRSSDGKLARATSSHSPAASLAKLMRCSRHARKSAWSGVSTVFSSIVISCSSGDCFQTAARQTAALRATFLPPVFFSFKHWRFIVIECAKLLIDNL